MAKDPDDPTWAVDWGKLLGALAVIVAGVVFAHYFHPISKMLVGDPIRSLLQ